MSFKIGTTTINKAYLGEIEIKRAYLGAEIVYDGGFVFDADALSYITAVETADTQALEMEVKLAINNFVIGCKTDSVWEAVKASCILAGARTLNGALVPLKGTAPINVNFVSGDYSRTTGLLGNGTTKYLDSQRPANADPQNSKHLAVYATTRNSEGTARYYMGSTEIRDETHLLSGITASKLSAFLSQRSISTSTGNLHSANGLFAASRSNSSSFIIRGSNTNETISAASVSSNSNTTYVFSANIETTPQFFSNSRLAFYSIGEAIDLTLLDARVTTLINALGAIP